jgi:hypothetical protein
VILPRSHLNKRGNLVVEHRVTYEFTEREGRGTRIWITFEMSLNGMSPRKKYVKE